MKDDGQQPLFDPMHDDIDDIIAHLDDIDRDDPRAWPATLANLIAVFSAHLTHSKNMPEDQAHAEAQVMVTVLANYFGGRQIYLPRDEKLRLALRDNLIWRQFDGSNVPALESKHRLTRQQIYNVIAQQRALHVKRVQPSFNFGETNEQK